MILLNKTAIIQSIAACWFHNHFLCQCFLSRLLSLLLSISVFFSQMVPYPFGKSLLSYSITPLPVYLAVCVCVCVVCVCVCVCVQCVHACVRACVCWANMDCELGTNHHSSSCPVHFANFCAHEQKHTRAQKCLINTVPAGCCNGNISMLNCSQ